MMGENHVASRVLSRSTDDAALLAGKDVAAGATGIGLPTAVEAAWSRSSRTSCR
jgi:hypothetical protein